MDEQMLLGSVGYLFAKVEILKCLSIQLKIVQVNTMIMAPTRNFGVFICQICSHP